jgi:response regulator RpfG family c-di-GMP phosphodiesterase
MSPDAKTGDLCMRSSTAIAETLVQNGVISVGAYKKAVEYMNNFDCHIIDALIDSNTMDEEALIKWLAQQHRTKFVTTQKLKIAKIGQIVLQKVPVDVAMKYNVFPILYDNGSATLSVVTSDAGDLSMLENVRKLAGASHIRSFVARPAAIDAAINKFYKGDIHAFTSIDKESIAAFQSMMDVYERNLLDEGTMVAATAEASGMGRKEQVLSEEDLARGDRGSLMKAGAKAGGFSIEIVKVMVSLLESSRENLSGHSMLTATNAEKMCQKMGLPVSETSAITLAALLHDIGKSGPYHLTAFNVAEWQGHRTNAQKKYDTPVRIFETAELPRSTIQSLRSMYERVDGMGLPEGLRKNEIPLGARIIAISDTFADLTSNPRNPYRRQLTTPEAMQVIQKGKDAVFDGNLVDLFAYVVSGDDLKRKLLTGAQTVLVVDSDAEQCAILEMQLTTRGFKATTCRRADDAIRILLNEPVNLVLSEVELKPFDGFEMKSRMNEDKRTAEIPLFYFTSRAEAGDVDRGFSLGAADYLVKPSNIGVVATKIQKYLSREAPRAAAAGVSGSLREMSIPDLVQILAHGQKTGLLKLGFPNGQHGEIHFVHGDIYNAMYGKARGEEAFFSMLKNRDGNFSLDPSFEADSKMINMTAEMLLLEGMRRMDEENR